jgi:predicted Zn-dependent protease
VAARLIARLALALVCGVAAAASITTYVSVKRVDHAREGFRGLARADFARALSELRRSDLALNPSNYRDQGVSVAVLHLGRPAEAERLAAQVTREQPQNPFSWISVTRIQVSRGRLAAARRSWQRARRLDPHLTPALPPGV